MKDGDHTDGHYIITLLAEQLTRTFEVLVIFTFLANYSCWDLLFLFPHYCVQSKKNIWVENMFWLYLAAPVSRNPRNPILGLFLFLLPALFPSQPSARSLAIMNSLYLPSFIS